jgi:tRNA-dihydrouridine synthase 1
MKEYEEHPEKFEDLDEAATEEAAEDIADYESSVRAVKACRRPWWVCQSHVRPVPKEAIEKGGIMLSKKEKKKLETQAEQEDEAAKAFGQHTDDPIAKAVAGVSENGSMQSTEQVPAPASVCG